MSQAGHPQKAVRTTPGNTRRAQLDVVLLKVVDGGLACCIFAVPLLMGGRQAFGQLALVGLAVVVATAWMLRQCLKAGPCWRSSSAELLLLAGVALLVAQTVSLPKSVLAWAAPKTAQILPLWTDGADPSVALGTWSCVSLAPEATRGGLTIFLAYGLLFLVTVQRIRTLEDVQRLLRWIALSVVIMAVFALVQLLTSNGKFFWFYEHPFSRTSDAAKGSFTNRNHFAHFLALGIGPLVWWLQDGLRRRRQGGGSSFGRPARQLQTEANLAGFRTLAFGVVLFAGLLSLSRGGMLAMLIAAAVSVGVCYRARRLSGRFVLSMAGVAALIGVLLAVHGLDPVSDRMEQLSSGSVDRLDAGEGRRTIWAAVCKAIPDFALFGSGVGSHAEVYPIYLEDPPETEFTHAENGPLQVLLETGAVGLTLVVAGIGFCAVWCIGGLRRAESKQMRVCIGAVLGSLAVSVAHSLADFVWYVPACMALVAILAGCACRLRQLAGDAAGKTVARLALPKPVALLAVVLLLALGTWMIGNRIGPTLAKPHWDHYRIMKLAAANPTTAEQQELAAASPEQLYEASLEAIDRMIAELQQVVACDPANARAHLDLVASYLRRFDHTQQRAENAMSLADIRDATARARDDARDPQQKQAVEQWLTRTIGPQGEDLRAAIGHTRRALAVCPLRGEGYLYLAELQFLQGPEGESAKAAYLDQALRVRPFHGGVLFEAGRAAVARAEALLAAVGTDPAEPELRAQFQREFDRAMQHWRRSFRGGREHQKRLIEGLAGRVPVGYFVENYRPDLQAMRMLRAAYAWLSQPEQSARVYQLYGDRCRAEGHPPGDAEAAAAWLQAELARLHFDYARIAHAEADTLDGEEAARVWLEAAWFHHLSGDRQQAYECAQRAYRYDPDDYDVRYTLALRMIDQQQYDTAEDHLRWCSRKRPDDEKLKWLLGETTKNRLRQQARTALRTEIPRTRR